MDTHAIPFHLERRLDYLQSFLAVTETGSIARAANQVFRAASAVTRAISELEKELDVPLFERKPRGMLPNTFGEAVKLRAQRICDEAILAADEFMRAERQTSVSQRNAIINLLFSGRQISLLTLLADLRNISSAAKSLGISQAGASLALARMEAKVGRPLFQRMLQGMVTTDATARLVIRAKRILSEIRQMDADISAISGNLGGSVAIGTLPLGRTFIIPTAIARVLAQHPGLRITTIESPYEQLIAQLRSGVIDMVFGALRPDDFCQGLILESLFEDRLGVIVRRGHPLASRKRLALADLLGEKWILPIPSAPGRRLIDASFQELGLAPPSPSVETGDLAIMRQLLNTSDLLTAISPRQFMFEIQSGSLVKLPVLLGRTSRQIGLTLRNGALLSPAARAVIDSIRATAQIRTGTPAQNSVLPTIRPITRRQHGSGLAANHWH